MLKQVNVVDGDGFVIENYMVDENDVVHDQWITEPIPGGFFIPKWDFQQEEWVEGLTTNEVEEKQQEIEEYNNRLTETEKIKQENEMLAMAILELGQIMMNGGK